MFLCGKTLFLHAQFLLLRMTNKLKCFINFIVHMAIARTLIQTMSNNNNNSLFNEGNTE